MSADRRNRQVPIKKDKTALCQLTTKEEEVVDRAFTRLDRNCDGRISKEELKAGLIVLGETPTKRRLQELFGAVDTDQSGYIEQDEFKMLMAEKFMEDRLKKVYTKTAFQLLDKNGDGFITRNEISQVVRDVGFDLTLDGLQELFTEADVNKDEKINYGGSSDALRRLVTLLQLDLSETADVPSGCSLPEPSVSLRVVIHEAHILKTLANVKA